MVYSTAYQLSIISIVTQHH